MARSPRRDQQRRSAQQAAVAGRADDARRAWADAASLVRAGLLIFLLLALCITYADPDLWGHVRFGRDIAAAHGVPRDDPYSFTSDVPWINHEWLAELIMYGSYAAAGPRGLVGLKALLVVGMLGLIAWSVRRDQAPPMVRDVLIGVAAFGIFPRFMAVRPQIFSVALFTLVLVLLREADRGRRGSLLLLPAVMASWCNLHGGWIVGLAVIEIWIALDALEGGGPWRARGRVLGIGVATVAATLVNPYGVGLWRFLWKTVGLTRPDIQDWQPLSSLPILPLLPWYVALAVGLAAVVWAGLPPKRSYQVVLALLAFVSFRVVRNDVFFILAVVLLLAPATAGWRWPPRLRFTWPGARVRPAIVAAAVIAEAIVFLPAFSIALRCVDLDVTNQHPKAAARFVRLNHLQGRMLTWFDWGEYAIWHFAPDLKVSMDGRRETVYSDALISAHWAFYDAKPGGVGLARTLNPDYIWLRSDLEVVPLLDQQGWTRIFTDRESVIFSRPTTRRFEQPAPEPPSARLRCFPAE